MGSLSQFFGDCLLLSVIFFTDYLFELGIFQVAHLKNITKDVRKACLEALPAPRNPPADTHAAEKETENEERGEGAGGYAFESTFHGEYLEARGQKFMRRPYEILQGILKSAKADFKKEWQKFNEECNEEFEKSEFEAELISK